MPISVNIESGTIKGFSALYQSNPQGNDEESIGKVNINVTGGNFEAINGGTLAVYSENKTGFISGGYFSSDPTAYVAKGKTIVSNDSSTYAYKIGDATTVGDAEVYTAPDAAPAVTVPDTITEKEALETAIKESTSSGLSAEAAAVAGDSQKITDADVQTGVEKGKEAGIIENNAEADSIKLVVQPYMDIEVKSYEASETSKQLEVEITPKYNLLATTSDTPIDNLNTTETDQERNAVVIASGLDLPVSNNTKVAISFQLPKNFITADEMNQVFVDHIKKDGSKETYKADVTSAQDGEDTIYTASFTTNGFSDFIFKVDSRTAVVKFGSDAEETTLTIADINKALPEETAPTGKHFGGWQFEGIDGTYTKLTDELFTALVEKGETVEAVPYFYTSSSSSSSTVDAALKAAKTQAASDVVNYVDTADYEEAEQAEIKTIIDKAKSDIEAAETVEEVKAIEAAVKEQLDKIETAAEKALIKFIGEIKLAARSKQVTLKNGKKAVKITWKTVEGEKVDFDGVEIYRSVKRYSGYGKKPIYTSKSDRYYNTAIKTGTKYYYKVRGFKYVNDEKVYTQYSLKAWRTVK